MEELVADARANGAEVREFGEGDEAELAKGNFLKPTLVLKPANDSRIVQEEQFGPDAPDRHVQERRGGDRARQRHVGGPRLVGLVGRPRARRGRRLQGPRRHDVDQRAQRPLAGRARAVRRLQPERHRPRDGSPRASSASPRPTRRPAPRASDLSRHPTREDGVGSRVCQAAYPWTWNWRASARSSPAAAAGSGWRRLGRWPRRAATWRSSPAAPRRWRRRRRPWPPEAAGGRWRSRPDTGADDSVAAMARTAIAELGGVDVLVNAAARPNRGVIAEDDLEYELNTKLRGYLRTIRRAHARDGGARMGPRDQHQRHGRPQHRIDRRLGAQRGGRRDGRRTWPTSSGPVGSTSTSCTRR